jgi:hypothetical protein
MRIAQVAPLYESVPPKLYGGTERVVYYLTEEMVRLGHDVTLFASGDSQTGGRLVPACDGAFWRDPDCRETLPHHVRLMESRDYLSRTAPQPPHVQAPRGAYAREAIGPRYCDRASGRPTTQSRRQDLR